MKTLKSDGHLGEVSANEVSRTKPDGRSDRPRSETVSMFQRAFLNIKNIIQEKDIGSPIEHLAIAFSL
ncbi:hypothetical protein HYW84_04250 [Candidatus Peregrinibacteria bacterium]|nr:hypothetical protein [Candidatus Peregrinibacteria bacterium]